MHRRNTKHLVRRRLAVGIAAAGVLILAVASPASAFGTGPMYNGHDHRCLDEDVSSRTHNGTRVQVWDCNGWNNQAWTWYADGTIRSSHDGRCLDEDIGSPTANGQIWRVQVWDCNGWANQKWVEYVPGQLTSAYDGGVLDEYVGDLNGYAPHNGTTVWVTNANGHNDEDWSCNCRVPYSSRF